MRISKKYLKTMPKIDQFFIDSAKKIRKEFLRLNKELDKYQKDVTNLSDYFKKTATELEKYQQTLNKNMNVEKAKSYIIEKLNSVEIESKKISNKITPINEAIEKLRNEELILYKSIKQKYPTISDDDLKRIIAEGINESKILK
jgi:hypothetical protein